MTTWPSGTKASTEHLDAGSDKPRLARPDIKQNVDNVNDIIDYFTDDTGDITIAGNELKFNKGYKEKINTLTSSSSITVDADLASVHKVTLSETATFNITNMEQGQSVVIIITQDGANQGTFRLDSSTTAIFSDGQNSLTLIDGSKDIVTLFNDGENLLGSVIADFK